MWRGVLVLIFAVASEAYARPPEGSSEAYARGEAQYQAGEFLAAAASFEEAYAREHDPSILFNIAQAYRFGKACAKAADHYRRFLAAVSDAPNARQVRDYITEQERCARPPANEQPPPRTGPPAVAGPRPARGRALRLSGLALGGAGLLALGAGSYFTWRVHDLEREHEGCSPCRLEALEALDRRGRRAEIAQLLAYGIGGLALGGGVLFYVAGHQLREASSVAIVPVGRGGIVAGTLRF
jgi:tetratricopeptide (TPR) repeat protein